MEVYENLNLREKQHILDHIDAEEAKEEEDEWQVSRKKEQGEPSRELDIVPIALGDKNKIVKIRAQLPEKEKECLKAFLQEYNDVFS